MIRFRIGLVAAALAFAASAGGAAWAADTGVAKGDTAKDGIALSNSYAGNSWRQQMLETWRAATKDALDQHLIAKTAIVNSNNSATEQSSQLETMILQGWNSIVIDAASPTALNGAIQQACEAKITVVSFDSLVTAPCATKDAYDYVKMGEMEVDFVAKQLHGKGNLLEIHGIAGTSVDADIHDGIEQAIKKYPGMKIVGSVYGNWTQSIAEKAVAGVLPTLPEVNAVVDQGGDGYGTYEAFKNAGRPIPLIIMGNRQVELALWKKLSEQPGGYHTMSLSSAPGCASIAFWTAQQILAGKEVPKVVHLPLLVITQSDLDAWLKATPPGGVATPVYTRQWTSELIDANLAHKPLPASPEPGANNGA